MDSSTISLGKSQTLWIVSSSPEGLTVETRWTSGGQRPGRHYHPRQDEWFEVLEGELTVELGAAPPRVLSTGDTLHVPRGTVHRMWNAGSRVTRATWRVAPRLGTEDMFRFIDGGITPLRVAAMLWRFRHEFRPAPWPR